MVTEEDVRRVALSVPGSIGRPCSRLPSFRVRDRLFPRIHELPDAFFVRCASMEERNELPGARAGQVLHHAAYDAEHPLNRDQPEPGTAHR